MVKRKTKNELLGEAHERADEIVYDWYRNKWRLEDELKELGIEWKWSCTFQGELAAVRQRIKTYKRMAGISLSEDEERELAFWIEQRVVDEVHRVVQACLRQLLK